MQVAPAQIFALHASPWQRVMAWRIGPLPLPLYVAACLVVVTAAVYKSLPNDLIGGLALLMLAGWLLSEMGARTTVLRHIGGPAILCLLLPSALIGYRVFDPSILKTVTTAMKTANLQYLYIAALVVGSILGMSHKVQIQGFLSMFISLAIGTLAGTLVLVGLGTLFVPWNQMVASLTLGYVVVCLVTVLAIVTSGFLVGRLMKMYPIEAAIVTACHSGLGGTGDVAILSASNRMELMPFAQISTRIGGACIVVLAAPLVKALT